MNLLTLGRRAQIIGMMVEGNSIRSITRMTGVSKNTIVKLLVDVGTACLKYQDQTLRNLTCRRLQLDEIWSFVYAKAKNVPDELREAPGVGDVWTWTAIDADTKLVPSWMVGDRSSYTANLFIRDLKSRLANRVQITTDGHRAYVEVVERIFGAQVDYAMLVKMYGETPEGDKKYSPTECIGAKKKEVIGNPNQEHISTSFAERQNLTMRMSLRRFTRLTNAFSKKIENHIHALSIYFMHYNFGRIHQTLRVTPAMEAKVAKHVWSLEEIAALVKYEAPKKRGPYRKRGLENVSSN